jgi:hypothetical protein
MTGPQHHPRLRPFARQRTDHRTSKVWVLPDGEAVSLDRWHFQWILANPDTVGRFGLDVTSLPYVEDPVRIAAIQAGFVRINYVFQTATVIVEAVVGRFQGAVARAVLHVLVENLAEIDRVRMNLFDDAVTRVVEQVDLELFTIPGPDARREKLVHHFARWGVVRA